MGLHPWTSAWGQEIPQDQLENERAQQFADFLSRQPQHLIQNVRYRKRDEPECVLFDVQAERPQRPPVDIRGIEPIGVIFRADDYPLVLALRSDFPDTEHQNLVFDGDPRCLCMDDRPWTEARLLWTPSELLGRIQTWLRRAARGELHDAAQPVEPFFGGSPLQIVVPREAFSQAAEARAELVGYLPDSTRRKIMVTKLGDHRQHHEAVDLVLLAYQVPAESMQRMRSAPGNLLTLTDFFTARGINLTEDLKRRIVSWTGASEQDARRLAHRFGLLIDLPIVNPRNQSLGGSQTIALLSDKTLGEVGEALGVLARNNSGAGSAHGYLRLLQPTPPIPEAVAGIKFPELAAVHVDFDKDRATQLAGHSQADNRKVALIGAGAIGSHVAECLYREGRFIWSIVDDDFLLPHNLARHTLSARDVGRAKAEALLQRLRRIRPDGAIEAIVANVIGGDSAAILSTVDLVFDATASVGAARAISDSVPATSRAASFFFNPAGTAAVLLLEDEGRSIRLRDLEADYYRQLLEKPELSGHLALDGIIPLHTGACRALTNRIPESRVSLLSGLIAHALGLKASEPGAFIGVWSMGPDGSISVTGATPTPATTYMAAGWTSSVHPEVTRQLHLMRGERLPAETGGVLVGILDTSARKMHVVNALPPPADSLGTVDSFERGIQNLTAEVENISAMTMGQVRYLGEWHSHPPSVPTTPSTTDLRQIGWLVGNLAPEGYPALMMIVGDNEVRVVLGRGE
jgi:integrative and conjugative element protein (TIGR02256 family)